MSVQVSLNGETKTISDVCVGINGENKSIDSIYGNVDGEMKLLWQKTFKPKLAGCVLSVPRDNIGIATDGNGDIIAAGGQRDYYASPFGVTCVDKITKELICVPLDGLDSTYSRGPSGGRLGDSDVIFAGGGLGSKSNTSYIPSNQAVKYTPDGVKTTLDNLECAQYSGHTATNGNGDFVIVSGYTGVITPISQIQSYRSDGARYTSVPVNRLANWDKPGAVTSNGNGDIFWVFNGSLMKFDQSRVATTEHSQVSISAATSAATDSDGNAWFYGDSSGAPCVARYTPDGVETLFSETVSKIAVSDTYGRNNDLILLVSELLYTDEDGNRKSRMYVQDSNGTVTEIMFTYDDRTYYSVNYFNIHGNWGTFGDGRCVHLGGAKKMAYTASECTDEIIVYPKVK